ncbi:terpene synthase [Micromonospora sp. C81]|uniref:terpene synthase family protein n=1 Tax=Micromonospora sp. C81 TaxID=2824881 RepID=UPI001B38D90E|nr:terpene synthase [Micromonospora sp. C81]MBQ1037073.1 terpene synthase [Micromonospora sp. C81]
MTVAAARALRAECPLPSRCSPHAEATQEWLAGWVRRFDLPLDDDELRQLDAGRIAWYAGRLYPDASAADLRTVAALWTWFFLLDDACDGPHGASGADVAALRDGVLHVLRHGPGARTAGFRGPLRRMLADAWQAPRARMPPPWQQRFADAVAHHLAGDRTEAENKTRGHVPAVSEYVALRRATSAAYVSYTMIEFVTGHALPDSVYHHPALRALAATGNDLLSWFNDLVSLEKDRVTSGGHNLVLAIAREQRLPDERAVEAAVARWRTTMGRFMELRATIPSFGPELDRAVAAHVEGVARSVRGTIDWSMESARYSASRS